MNEYTMDALVITPLKQILSKGSYGESCFDPGCRIALQKSHSDLHSHIVWMRVQNINLNAE